MILLIKNYERHSTEIQNFDYESDVEYDPRQYVSLKHDLNLSDILKIRLLAFLRCLRKFEDYLF